ncbi:hypothetical protein NDU88_003713 [Pleurodeles waltl]|uniref:Uncharacterized protein n=1 Tax=Pleurodeles waltl TaxID=8319 RepID=A0AAV7Q9Q6_PLEWA|nr:hypothetical protein NDU88_003713 [Pleurodeles waltl]
MICAFSRSRLSPERDSSRPAAPLPPQCAEQIGAAARERQRRPRETGYSVTKDPGVHIATNTTDKVKGFLPAAIHPIPSVDIMQG